MLFLNFPSLKENIFSYGTAAEREREKRGGLQCLERGGSADKRPADDRRGHKLSISENSFTLQNKSKVVFFSLNAPREGFWEGESKHGSGRGQELKTGLGFKIEDEEEAVDRVSSHLIRWIYGKFNKERQRVKVYSLFVLC